MHGFVATNRMRDFVPDAIGDVADQDLGPGVVLGGGGGEDVVEEVLIAGASSGGSNFAWTFSLSKTFPEIPSFWAFSLYTTFPKSPSFWARWNRLQLLPVALSRTLRASTWLGTVFQQTCR
jgi:hypothetical protein